METTDTNKIGVVSFLAYDHCKDYARRADHVRRVVDGELGAVDLETVRREMFDLAVIVRGLASEMSTLALTLGDEWPRPEK